MMMSLFLEFAIDALFAEEDALAFLPVALVAQLDPATALLLFAPPLLLLRPSITLLLL